MRTDGRGHTKLREEDADRGKNTGRVALPSQAFLSFWVCLVSLSARLRVARNGLGSRPWQASNLCSQVGLPHAGSQEGHRAAAAEAGTKGFWAGDLLLPPFTPSVTIFPDLGAMLDPRVHVLQRLALWSSLTLLLPLLYGGHVHLDPGLPDAPTPPFPPSFCFYPETQLKSHCLHLLSWAACLLTVFPTPPPHTKGWPLRGGHGLLGDWLAQDPTVRKC